MGARESSLYQRMSATESSPLAGLISQDRPTLPLTSARLTIDAVGASCEMIGIVVVGVGIEGDLLLESISCLYAAAAAADKLLAHNRFARQSR